MFDDIVKKHKKRLTVDDITWDKSCNDCGYGNKDKSDLKDLVFCDKDQAHRVKGYFCYYWIEQEK
jgi:hypothetical protein